MFIVGDDDQSIYRFRGAKPEIMLGFTKDYPQAKQTLLGINYRSTSTIVDAAVNLIRHNKTRYEKKLCADRGAGKTVATTVWADAQSETKGIVEEIQDLSLIHICWSIPGTTLKRGRWWSDAPESG